MNERNDSSSEIKPNKLEKESTGRKSYRSLISNSNSEYGSQKSAKIRVSRAKPKTASSEWALHYSSSKSSNKFYSNYKKKDPAFGKIDGEIGRLKSQSKSERSKHMEYEKSISTIKGRINITTAIIDFLIRAENKKNK